MRPKVECRICGVRRAVYDTTPSREAPMCVACQVLAEFYAHPTGPWVADGLCAEVDSELFYPPANAAAHDAKSICARCPVRTECLTYALEAGERWGVWGGMTPTERKRLMKKGTAA